MDDGRYIGVLIGKFLLENKSLQELYNNNNIVHKTINYHILDKSFNEVLIEIILNLSQENKIIFDNHVKCKQMCARPYYISKDGFKDG